MNEWNATENGIIRSFSDVTTPNSNTLKFSLVLSASLSSNQQNDLCNRFFMWTKSKYDWPSDPKKIKCDFSSSKKREINAETNLDISMSGDSPGKIFELINFIIKIY